MKNLAGLGRDENIYQDEQDEDDDEEIVRRSDLNPRPLGPPDFIDGRDNYLMPKHETVDGEVANLKKHIALQQQTLQSQQQ